MSNEHPESSTRQGTARSAGQRGSTVAPGEDPGTRTDEDAPTSQRDSPAGPRHRIEDDIEAAERDVGGRSEPT